MYHNIEIGKVGNLSAWNENFRAKISDFFSFFAERNLSLGTLIQHEHQIVKT